MPFDDTIIGSFHSHPRGSAFPSKADKKFFHKYPINLILSLGEQINMRSFDENGIEIMLNITGNWQKHNIKKEAKQYSIMQRKMRGQISLDLILILIVAVITITTMSVFVGNFQQASEEVALENQLDKISFELADFVTASQVMSSTTFESKIKIPQINYDGKKYLPIVAIDGSEVVVSVDFLALEKRSTFSMQLGQKIEADLVNGYLISRNTIN